MRPQKESNYLYVHILVARIFPDGGPFKGNILYFKDFNMFPSGSVGVLFSGRSPGAAKPPTGYRSLSGSWDPNCPEERPLECPRECPREYPTGLCLGPFGRRAPECPTNVLRVFQSVPFCLLF